MHEHDFPRRGFQGAADGIRPRFSPEHDSRARKAGAERGDFLEIRLRSGHEDFRHGGNVKCGNRLFEYAPFQNLARRAVFSVRSYGFVRLSPFVRVARLFVSSVYVVGCLRSEISFRRVRRAVFTFRPHCPFMRSRRPSRRFRKRTRFVRCGYSPVKRRE